MNMEEAFKQLTGAFEVFENLGTVRRKLIGTELTADLFDELNGTERGLENLIGRDVVINFDDVGEVATLRKDIFESLIREEMEVGKLIHASLECYCEDLVRICSQYDAYSTQNGDVRTKLVEKLKGLTKDAANSFLEQKLDFPCFAQTNCLMIVELMTDLLKFFDTDTFNLKRLAELSKVQGADMSDEDKEFLKTLYTVVQDEKVKPGWEKMDVLWGDRLTNATVQALGFNPKNIVELIKMLGKTENTFYKVIRQIREMLVREDATTDEVAVKNTQFYNAVSRVIWYARDLASLDQALSEQLSLIYKSAESIVNEPPKSELGEGTDNKGNPPTLENDGGDQQ